MTVFPKFKIKKNIKILKKYGNYIVKSAIWVMTHT
jgi:hypothetical protein